jgi:SAM-dependent methyltransferase
LPRADEPTPPAIDVERLVEDLRARAARIRERGGYGDDVGAGPVPIERPDRPVVRFRPELGYSSKPLVGRLITGAKQLALRALFHVFDDLARQADSAVVQTWARLEDLERRIAASEAHSEAALAGEAAERERTQRDTVTLSRRLDALEHTLADIQAPARLARLERYVRAAAASAAAEAPASAANGAAGAVSSMLSMDYESFEGRFRPEDAVRDHQRRYVDILAGRRRVVDVGCGRGELVEMLNEAGVDAYGVELDPDFVARAAERGVPVRQGDGIAHVAELAAGSVDGVVASHVVEHLEPQEVLRLVAAAHNALAPDGVLILETPNPESLVAGSINFHRDLTHRRPIHPDTLAFICRSAGFREVDILRLSPVPDAERLPPPPGSGPEAEHLAHVLDRLNAIMFGYQDYAVVARR